MKPTAEIQRNIRFKLTLVKRNKERKTLRNRPCLCESQSTAGFKSGTSVHQSSTNESRIMSLILLILVLASGRLWLPSWHPLASSLCFHVFIFTLNSLLNPLFSLLLWPSAQEQKWLSSLIPPSQWTQGPTPIFIISNRHYSLAVLT